MAYTKTVYVDVPDPLAPPVGAQPLNAANMNKNETGIEATAIVADGAVPKATATTAGDLLYATSPSVLARLAIGTNGYVLVSNGTAPSWVNPSTLGTAIVTNVQSGTTYTLILTDQDKALELTNASAVTVTIPPYSTVAFPTGSVIELLRYGAGEVSVSPGAGVTLLSPLSARRLNLQYSSAVIRKRSTDEWLLEGDIKV